MITRVQTKVDQVDISLISLFDLHLIIKCTEHDKDLTTNVIRAEVPVHILMVSACSYVASYVQVSGSRPGTPASRCSPQPRIGVTNPSPPMRSTTR